MCSKYSVSTACRRRCARRSACSAARAPQTIVKRPKPAHARRSDAGGLCARERVDDAAEEDRLGELCGREAQIGDRQQPTEACLGPELTQDAEIQAEEVRHGPPPRRLARRAGLSITSRFRLTP